MSSNLVTLKSNAYALVRNFTKPPQRSMWGNVINNFSSLECWVITKTSCTCTPSLDVLLGMIFIKKQPSAEMKPANQYGCKIFLFLTKGLVTGTTSGKAFFG